MKKMKITNVIKNNSNTNEYYNKFCHPPLLNIPDILRRLVRNQPLRLPLFDDCDGKLSQEVYKTMDLPKGNEGFSNQN